MKVLISLVFLCLLGVGHHLYGEQTVVLQHGSDGYTGCKWTNLLGPSPSNGGNVKYAYRLTGNFLVVALYQC